MKKKQAIAFLLSTTMAVGGAVQAFAAASDINGHWAETTIAKWQSAGKIGGYEDGTFKPDKTITRAEFVRLLNTTTTTSFTSNASINFSDVKESDWFFADVAKAVGSKITSGFEDGTFRPGETVTRAQAAVFICNAKGLAPNESAANTFADAAQIPAWAKGAVGAVVSSGYMSGYPDGTFGAGKGMTRAEAVSTLDRFSGTTTTPAPDNQGVSTPDTDKDDTTVAEVTKQEGNMVWRSGGGGGGSRKSSSSSGSSSSDNESDVINKNTTIATQAEANKLKNKTIYGKTDIYLNSNLELSGITFKNDVTIHSDDTVAAAYIGDDTAVAAANSGLKWVITLVNGTSFDSDVTVRSTKVDARLVEIRTAAKKSIGNFIAKTAARIVGFNTSRIQASAPVQVAEGSVETVTAQKGAELVVEKGATVDNVTVNEDAAVTVQDGAEVKTVAVSGDAKADIALEGSAKVAEVAISGNASAGVKVEGSANVGSVKLEDSATANVDVAKDATIDKITSTSTGKTEIAGAGTVSKVEATDKTTIDTSKAEKPPVVEEIGGTEEEKPETVLVEKIEIKVANGGEAEIENKEGAILQLSAVVTPTNATNKDVTWTVDNKEVATIDATGLLTMAAVADKEVKTLTVTATAKDDSKKTATIKITIVDAGEKPIKPTVTGVKIDYENNAVEVGGELQLTATVEGENLTDNDKGVIWESSDETIAKVDENGKVAGVGVGKATITAKSVTDPARTATLDITVVEEGETAVTGVKITGANTVKTGAETQLTAEVLGIGITPTNYTIAWESSDEKVATIAADDTDDTKATVTGVAKGSATITATAVDADGNNVKASDPFVITVEEATAEIPAPTGIESAAGNAKGETKISGLKVGTTYEYILSGKVEDIKSLNWNEAIELKDFAEGATSLDATGMKYMYIRIKADGDTPASAVATVTLEVNGDATTGVVSTFAIGGLPTQALTLTTELKDPTVSKEVGTVKDIKWYTGTTTNGADTKTWNDGSTTKPTLVKDNFYKVEFNVELAEGKTFANGVTAALDGLTEVQTKEIAEITVTPTTTPAPATEGDGTGGSEGTTPETPATTAKVTVEYKDAATEEASAITATATLNTKSIKTGAEQTIEIGLSGELAAAAKTGTNAKAIVTFTKATNTDGEQGTPQTGEEDNTTAKDVILENAAVELKDSETKITLKTTADKNFAEAGTYTISSIAFDKDTVAKEIKVTLPDEKLTVTDANKLTTDATLVTKEISPEANQEIEITLSGDLASVAAAGTGGAKTAAKATVTFIETNTAQNGTPKEVTFTNVEVDLKNGTKDNLTTITLTTSAQQFTAGTYTIKDITFGKDGLAADKSITVNVKDAGTLAVKEAVTFDIGDIKWTPTTSKAEEPQQGEETGNADETLPAGTAGTLTIALTPKDTTASEAALAALADEVNNSKVTAVFTAKAGNTREEASETATLEGTITLATDTNRIELTVAADSFKNTEDTTYELTGITVSGAEKMVTVNVPTDSPKTIKVTAKAPENGGGSTGGGTTTNPENSAEGGDTKPGEDEKEPSNPSGPSADETEEGGEAGGEEETPEPPKE